MLEKHALI